MTTDYNVNGTNDKDESTAMDGIDPSALDGLTFNDPFADVFFGGNMETPKGMMREMLGAGDKREDMYTRIRSTPRDRQEWVDMDFEDMWVYSQGKPDEEMLRTEEMLLTISDYGEARHEIVEMYTRIMSPFQGPGSWQKGAKNRMLRGGPNEGGTGEGGTGGGGKKKGSWMDNYG